MRNVFLGVVTDTGALVLGRPKDEVLSLPGAVDGDVVRAKRTARVLLEARPALDEGTP